MRVISCAVAVTVAVSAGAEGGLSLVSGECLPDVFEPKARILFQGDSITHGGRLGDMNHYLGHGYQAIIAHRYLGFRPELGLQFLNRAVSGDNTPKLLVRWEKDAVHPTAFEYGYGVEFGLTNKSVRGQSFDFRPDVLSLLVGINDGSTEPVDYERNLEELIRRSRTENPKLQIILGEPFQCPLSPSVHLAELQAAMARIALRHGLPLVPYQRLFNETLVRLNSRPKYWSWDSIHPTYAAHQHMADLWLRTVADWKRRPVTNTALIAQGRIEETDYNWYERHAQVLKTQLEKSHEVVLIGDGGIDPRTADTARTLDLGFAKDRIQNVLWRLNHGEMDGVKPARVVLHVGAENLIASAAARANTPDEIVEGLVEVIRRLHEKAPEAKIEVLAVRSDAAAPVNVLLAKKVGEMTFATFLADGKPRAASRPVTFGNDRVKLAVDARGCLLSLSNCYARAGWTDGAPLWRMSVDGAAGETVSGGEQAPAVAVKGGRLVISYDSLACGGRTLDVKLVLSVSATKDGAFRFAAELENREPNLVIRDFSYPLVGNLRPAAKGTALLTTQAGGRRFADPAAALSADHALSLAYPGESAANCFALANPRNGLYFGVHDPAGRPTRHVFRLTPDATNAWTRLEAGFARRLDLASGQTWSDDSACLVPYAGDWKTTARICRSRAAAAGCPVPSGFAVPVFADGTGFPEWFRYAYPGVPLADAADESPAALGRRLRLGLSPGAAAHAALLRKYPQLAGRYLHTDGLDGLFRTKGLCASTFEKDGSRAFVVTTPKDEPASGTVYFPGSLFKTYDVLGSANVKLDGERVTFDLEPNAVVVLAPVGDSPKVEKLGTVLADVCESNPVFWKGKPYLFQFSRMNGCGRLHTLEDLQTVVPSIGPKMSMHCAFADGDRMVVTAMRGRNSFGHPKEFAWIESTDLVHWSEPKTVFCRSDWGSFFNTSLCKADDGRYVLATEIYCQGPKHVMTFVESRDLVHWDIDEEKGYCRRRGGGYCGSPCLKHHAGWFYFFYLEQEPATEGRRPQYRMRVVRSRDLKAWTRGNRAVLAFDEDDRKIHPKAVFPADELAKIAICENLNDSDIDMCDVGDDLCISYNWGNQAEIQYVALARVKGVSERQFCESFFTGGAQK